VITNAPAWLQPLLWIASMALAGCAIVLIWRSLVPFIERRHVESMSLPARNWRKAVVGGCILLLAFAIVAIVLVLART
jgi:lipid-A-disaccharide synthase-like uncharacterized protein